MFGHNPLRLRSFQEATHAERHGRDRRQRTFSPLYPSYRSAFADLLGVRFIATGVPVEQIDTSLKPGDLDFIARTKDAYVYENPRALPRVMLLTDWRLADFDDLFHNGWPDVDPRRTVLLKKAPVGFPGGAVARGTARLLRYANTEVVVEVEAPRAASCCSTISGIPGGEPTSTGATPKSSRPMRSFAPWSARAGGMWCASPSIPSRAPSPRWPGRRCRWNSDETSRNTCTASG